MDTASETAHIDQEDNIPEGEGNTQAPNISKEGNQDDQQHSEKEEKSDLAKDDYEDNTESMSSHQPSKKGNTDEDFQPGMTSSSESDEDDHMDKNMPTPHRRKNQG